MARGLLHNGPLPIRLLENVFLNGRSAAEIAKRDGSPARLSVRALRRFPDTYVGPGEAHQLMARLSSEVRLRGDSTLPIRLRFDHVAGPRAVHWPGRERFVSNSAERSCFVIVNPGDSSDAVSSDGWNRRVRETILQVLDRAELYRPETLAALFDLDNTVWAGDVGEVTLQAAVSDRPIVSWSKGAPVSPALKRVRRHETPYHYYTELYERNPAAAYHYNSDVFAGLTLREAHEAFVRAGAMGLLPKPYAEMRTLFHQMQEQGISVGLVSASPLFFILPMLERAGFKVPVSRVEGVDVYVTSPHGSGEEVLLSRLIQSEPPRSWDEFLRTRGKLMITRVSEIAPIREGKGAAGRTIVTRHVREWNGRHRAAERPLIESDVRLLAVFGDNFGPFRIHQGDIVQQAGNDHGMLWAAPLLSGATVFNLVRATDRGATIDCAANQGHYDHFKALQTQSVYLGYNLVFSSQVGIAAGPRAGQFDPSELPF